VTDTRKRMDDAAWELIAEEIAKEAPPRTNRRGKLREDTMVKKQVEQPAADPRIGDANADDPLPGVV
jgi:hypothetical protein